VGTVLGVDPILSTEIFDFTGNLDAEAGGVELGNPGYAAATGFRSLPKRLATRSVWTHGAYARNDDPPLHSPQYSVPG
jgi:hypothetical protein